MCAIVCGVWLFAFVCFQNCFNEFDFADLTLSCVSSKQFGSFSFATMCGLVVPIALAHAGCILHLHGAACPGDEPTKRQDIEQQVKLRLALQSDAPGRRSRLESVVAVAAFHSLNHYHGQWCGRSWATSCGGCFETEPDVGHCSKNASVHVFSVWLVAFVF